MGKLHEIRERFDSFTANLNVNISLAIKANEVDLVNMNRKQLLESKDSFGKQLIHKSTGVPTLSFAYAKRTNKSTPNLFLKGDFQNEMFLEVNENNMTYFISSFDRKQGILTENYGNNIFGIPENRQTEAKEKNLKSFGRLLKSTVFKR